MNKTVELVNEWGAYEARYPEASIEEFCRFYLTQQRAKEATPPPFGGRGIPPTTRSFLSKLLGVICTSTGMYFEKAFADIPEIRQKEDFYFLNNIFYKGECRKTEVVYEQMLGLTTGIDALNRLLAAELIAERPDPSDKRAKLLSVTPKGQEVLQQCFKAAQKVSQLVFGGLSDEDVLLCIQLLKGVEARHSKVVMDAKEMTFEQISDLLNGAPDERHAAKTSRRAFRESD